MELNIQIDKEYVTSEKLYNDIKNAVYMACQKFVLPSFLTKDDILQEIIIKINNTDLSKVSNINGYIYFIIKNYLINLYRKHSKDNLIYIDDDNINVEIPCNIGNGCNKLINKELLHAVTLLPKSMKTITTMFYIDGMKYKDIAKELNITESTVKTQLFKMKAKLNKYYKI